MSLRDATLDERVTPTDSDPVSNRGTPPSLQEKLAEAFSHTELSHRQLARLILGANASKDQIDSLRAQISKWRNTPGKGVSAPNSARLARGFSKAGLILPADYFLSEPRHPEDEIADLRRRVEDLERRQSG